MNFRQKLAGLDDAVQRKFRQMYGVNDSAEFPYEEVDPRVSAYVQAMHPLQSQVDDTWQGKAALLGSRAVQAGMITGAGIGLINFTNQIMSSLGGPADNQSPSELPIDNGIPNTLMAAGGLGLAAAGYGLGNSFPYNEIPYHWRDPDDGIDYAQVSVDPDEPVHRSQRKAYQHPSMRLLMPGK